MLLGSVYYSFEYLDLILVIENFFVHLYATVAIFVTMHMRINFKMINIIATE